MPPVRTAVRTVVRDPDGRVLLLRYDDPPPVGVHWATPGGGVEPGEAPRQAALRELLEETGCDDAVLGDELGRTTRLVLRDDGLWQQEETHFAATVTVPERDVSTAGHAVDLIAAWGWFSPAEAAALPAPVQPPEVLGWL